LWGPLGFVLGIQERRGRTMDQRQQGQGDSFWSSGAKIALLPTNKSKTFYFLILNYLMPSL